MSRYWGIIVLLCWTSAIFSQEISLPAENSIIHLRSGKLIKNVTLWKLDTIKIEYVKNGNLCDIMTMEVDKIETDYQLISITPNQRIMVNNYDYFVTGSDDTTHCIISGISKYYLYYYLPKEPFRKKILLNSIRKFEGKASEEYASEGIYVPADEKLITESISSSEINKAPISDSLNKPLISREKRLIGADSIIATERNPDYYYQSFEAGISEGEKYDATTDKIGGILLGLTFGSHILTVMSFKEQKPSAIPAHVDPRMFEEGYRKASEIKKAKSAANGAIIGKTLIMFLIILSL